METATFSIAIDYNLIIFVLAVLGSFILILYIFLYSKKRKKVSDLIKNEDLLEEIKTEKKLKKLAQKKEYPYLPKKLLTETETEVYYKLLEELPFFNILSKVPYSSFLDVKEGFNKQLLKGKISKLVADFVICKRDFSVIVVLELDKNTDEKVLEKKEKVLKSANIPLYIWDTQNPPSSEDLQEFIKSISQK
ncbi:MAG: hypothetical protein DSY66_01965 [Persephonella sp.]|nr:MAG: hypothetical protein DSY66_01965 [Persephonella sp.]